eukprot:66367-Prymnesium_polylepis.1
MAYGTPCKGPRESPALSSCPTAAAALLAPTTSSVCHAEPRPLGPFAAERQRSTSSTGVKVPSRYAAPSAAM